VVLDPRRTPTCDSADLHLPLRAGTDVMLFNRLLSYLSRSGASDESFLSAHTRGAARALLVADNTAGDVGAVARHCGVDPTSLTLFYDWFRRTERVVTLFSQGVNQSSSGTDKANSIINAHLLTGRIGRPGMGPFSITGQPNAMGGREVGGLANTLAAHLEFDQSAHRELLRRFWNAPNLAPRPGLKAVDLFEAVYRGKIKAIWIISTNPVVSLPNAERARQALRRCELVVVSDVVADTDTVALGQVVLPASAWGEKDGTVTNSDRHISRQRRFLEPPGEARPDWWMLCEVAKRLGFGDAFDYATPAQIFDEHARLSALENEGSRVFNIGGLVGLGESGYGGLSPIQWPVVSGVRPGSIRLFGDGRFAHPDGRARLIATQPRAPRFALDQEYPLVLNTGRVRDQWHSMTRSGRAPRLTTHCPEPFIDMHAADALIFGVGEGGLARVVTRWGSMVARVQTSGAMARGSIFVPIHWSDVNSSDARVGAVVNPAVDSVSGEPEFKATPARVDPFVVNYHGFILSRRVVPVRGLSWWTRADEGRFHRYELAGRSVPGSWPRWARTLLDAGESSDWLDYEDVSACTYRAALVQGERLEACLFTGPLPQLPSRAWLGSLFDRDVLSKAERSALLAGRPPSAALDAGVIVCACFSVGHRSIERAIAEGCRDPASIGRVLKAGTNCGSCVPELRQLIDSTLAATGTGTSNSSEKQKSWRQPVDGPIVAS
jgi:assimilatory nitrate reductase catalytic subunit